MPNSESRKVILITGAAGALGSALAHECALAGWELVLLDRDPKALDRLHERITGATGLDPILQPLDLARLDPAGCEDVVAGIEAVAGRLDALVHCAAAFEGLRPMDQVDPRDWVTVFQINVHAAWLLSMGCIPLLRESGAGSLLFVSENLERVSGAFWGEYGASKWAVEAMARQFAAELRSSGMHVMCVDPGPMQSPLRAKAYHSENPAQVRSPSVPAAQILDLLERRRTMEEVRIRLEEFAD